MESEANEEVLASTPTEPGIMKYPCLMDCYAPNWTVNDVALVLRSLLLLYFVASSLPCHADPRPTADVPPHPVPWMFPLPPSVHPPFHPHFTVHHLHPPRVKEREDISQRHHDTPQRRRGNYWGATSLQLKNYYSGGRTEEMEMEKEPTTSLLICVVNSALCCTPPQTTLDLWEWYWCSNGLSTALCTAALPVCEMLLLLLVVALWRRWMMIDD